MFRRFMIVCWLFWPLVAMTSDQENEDYVTPDGLYCGPLIKDVDGDLDEILDRYESLSDDEFRCIVDHTERCPDFLMRQCKEKGWGKDTGGGCEHLLMGDRDVELGYFIEYCMNRSENAPQKQVDNSEGLDIPVDEGLVVMPDGSVKTPEGLVCAGLLFSIEAPLMDAHALAKRYAALEKDQAECVDRHMAVCPKLVWDQCNKHGWADRIGGGCGHALTYEDGFDLQYYIEYCDKVVSE